MSFHILSDIHLELYKSDKDFIKRNQNLFTTRGENLILAGDIGYPFKTKKRPKIYGLPKTSPIFFNILSEFKKNFKNVIYVSGNHEYYQCVRHNIDMDTVDNKIREICDELGILFLQCESIFISGIHVHGCTLFSNVTREDANMMNDQMRITSIEKINTTHKKHLNWLKSLNFRQNELDKEKHIVITHHLPISYPNLSTGYYTDILEDIQQQGPIEYWICGHYHENIYKIRNGTKVVSNPLGYIGEHPSKNMEIINI